MKQKAQGDEEAQGYDETFVSPVVSRSDFSCISVVYLLSFECACGRSTLLNMVFLLLVDGDSVLIGEQAILLLLTKL